MSDQERYDWDDDMDFESLADEQTMQEGSVDELEDFEEDSNPPEIDVESSSESEENSQQAVQPGGRKLGVSAGGLGTLFAISTLVAGLGLAGALIFVSGLDPLSLWQPQGMLQVDQWFNFQDHPLNLLYILTGGILALGFLGSLAVARSIKVAQKRHESVTVLLDMITDLRLNNEDPWQNADFKTDPQVAAFVAETLGSWRLQMAREKKNLGLEGELRRLQKALDSKSRDDMVGRFDNPFVGSMADSIVQMHDEGEAARNESKGIREKDQHQGTDLMGILQDARSWTQGSRESIGAQGVAVERLSTQLAELGSLVSRLKGNKGQSEVSAAVADITREVTAWAEESANSSGLTRMNELVDRGSKLAFQIAMEVARLGTRGERLLPMTQSLEELTNEFRQATTALSENSGNEAQAQIKSRLDQVTAKLEEGPGEEMGRLTQVAGELIPEADQIHEKLVAITQGFEPQADRLSKLGENLSSFTGVPFNAEDITVGNPDNPPEGSLNLTQHDPFSSGVQLEEDSADVDPFRNSDDLLGGGQDGTSDSGFLTSVTPGEETAYGELSPEPELELEPELPSEEETVYDLNEFGAVQVDESDHAESEEEKVYDLAEFGAVALT